ncbi:unnamed protein product, partial [Phaeothamnion confervicola]
MLGAFAGMYGGDDEGDPAAKRRALSAGQRPNVDDRSYNFAGLDNQGATCYLNSLLQIMYMTPELRGGLYSVPPELLGVQWYEEQEEKERERKKKVAQARRKERVTAELAGKEVVEPDEALVTSLEQMGFPTNGARRAAVATKNAGLEQATEWCLAHGDDVDFDTPLPGFSEADAIVAAGGGEGPVRDGKGGKGKGKGKGKTPPRLIPLELQRLFARLQYIRARAVGTEELTSKGFQWESLDGRQQHDVQELNRLLVDALDKSLAKVSVNPLLVSTLYQGTVVNQVECRSCGYKSDRQENFYDLGLQVVNYQDMVTSLLAYTRPEPLEGENQYHCDRCTGKRPALRRQLIRQLPPLLIFSLNRFRFDTEKLERVKVNDKFKYPLVLDMEPFVEAAAWRRAPGGGSSALDDAALAELAGGWNGRGGGASGLRAAQEWVAEEWMMGEDAVRAGAGIAAAAAGAASRPHDAGLAAVAARHSAESGPGGTSLVYDLFAVVVHRGDAYSGHYHAYIRDLCNQGEWLSPREIKARAAAQAAAEEARE